MSTCAYRCACKYYGDRRIGDGGKAEMNRNCMYLEVHLLGLGCLCYERSMLLRVCFVLIFWLLFREFADAGMKIHF